MEVGTFAWAMDQLLHGEKVTRGNLALPNFNLGLAETTTWWYRGNKPSHFFCPTRWDLEASDWRIYLGPES